MPNDYKPLPIYPLETGASYMRPRQETLPRVTLDNPALDVMTDLTEVTTITVEPNAPIHDALQKMIHSGVRLLLVTNPQGTVLGVISAKDIQGEKPMQFVNKVGVRYEDILVRDIMTPYERLDVLRYEDVAAARVGEVVATLRQVGRQHALVVQGAKGEPPALRGIFSTTQIGRQLGTPIETPERATTFAEIEVTLQRQS